MNDRVNQTDNKSGILPDDIKTEQNAEIRRIWEKNADFWDDRIGDGNQFQDELIEPSTLKLLGDISGLKVLDIACGAGRFSRRMAGLGADVLAVDFCKTFLERARKRTPDSLKNIEYRFLDATDENQLLALGNHKFDTVVCTMGLMDMADIEPLFATLPKLLKPGGRFVFSLMHPCFQTVESTVFSEMTEYDGRTEMVTGVKITKYLAPGSWKGIGVIGQPERHYYFHRPLSNIFNTAFRAGFMIYGFEEPALREREEKMPPLSWRAMRDVPPILVVGMKIQQDLY